MMYCSKATLKAATLIIGGIIAFLLPRIAVTAQVFPQEGRELNYRLVRFTTGLVGGNEIQVAKGHFDNETGFNHNMIAVKKVQGGETTVELPYFDMAYTWRVSGNKELRHFSVGTHFGVDTNAFRLRLTENNLRNKNFYIFCDATHALYNSSGAPVWYVPVIPGKTDNMSMFRDLKMTPQGTITFINNDDIYEINWDGEILWSGPANGDNAKPTSGRYHHEFTRLKNGHYMALTNEIVCIGKDGPFQINSYLQNSNITARKYPVKEMPGDREMCQPYCTVREYDANGKEIWTWESFPYLYEANKGNFDFAQINTHSNSFWLDEKRGFVYVSLRDCNQIIKVKYSTGKVVAAYGTGCKSTALKTATAQFCAQHSVRIIHNGDMMLVNNNECQAGKTPNIKIFKESGGKLANTWQMTLPINWPSDYGTPTDALTGGNVAELTDNNIFISDCLPYSDISIVSRQKKVLWSGLFEQFSEGKWKPKGQYRTSIVESDNQLLRIMKYTGHQK